MQNWEGVEILKPRWEIPKSVWGPKIGGNPIIQGFYWDFPGGGCRVQTPVLGSPLVLGPPLIFGSPQVPSSPWTGMGRGRSASASRRWVWGTGGVLGSPGGVGVPPIPFWGVPRIWGRPWGEERGEPQNGPTGFVSLGRPRIFQGPPKISQGWPQNLLGRPQTLRGPPQNPPNPDRVSPTVAPAHHVLVRGPQDPPGPSRTPPDTPGPPKTPLDPPTAPPEPQICSPLPK